MTSIIRPFIEKDIEDFLKSKKIDFKESGVKHIVFPSIIKKNYIKLISNLNSENVDVYFAIKSTYSKSLIEEAKNNNIGLEVSSLGELKLAKKLKSKKIIAGGPKNIPYLKEAVKTNCIISVDSIFELENLIKLNSKNKIILRISNPICESKNILMKTSRFGISRKDLNIALNLIKNSKKVILKGFHFHDGGYEAENKREFIKYFLDLILELKYKGFNDLDIIDIGGGFRSSTISNQKDWLSFINSTEKVILNKEDLKIWGNYAYGLEISDKGKILGRGLAESKGVKQNIISELNTMISPKIIDNQISISDLLFENGIKLIIEPGFDLSTTAGITIMDVIGVKETSCSAKLVQVDGHIFSISSNMIEHLTDPLLISKTKKNDKKFEGYIIGSLCREDDFLIRRKISFSQEPKEGDKLIFFNTGSYAMSYERCNPQRFEKAKYFSAIKIDNKWRLENDN